MSDSHHSILGRYFCLGICAVSIPEKTVIAMQIEICLEHSQVIPRNLQHGWQRAYWIWDSNLGFDAHSLEAPRHKFQDCREAGLLNSILYRFDCRSLDINKKSVLKNVGASKVDSWRKAASRLPSSATVASVL